jgi:predicted ester cyclase
MHLDVTIKAENRRVNMSEIALYTVENDKITRAEFLYGDMK